MMDEKLFDDGRIYRQNLHFRTKERAEKTKQEYESSGRMIVHITEGEFDGKPGYWIWLRFVNPDGYKYFDSNTEGIIKHLAEYEEDSDLLKKTLENGEWVTLPDGRKWFNTSKRYPYDVKDLRSGIRRAKKEIKEMIILNLSAGTDIQLGQEDWKEVYKKVLEKFPKLLDKMKWKEVE